MDPVTHAATGLLLSQLIPAPSRAAAAAAGLVFTFLPDLDYLLTAVDRLSFIRHHRGFTHSLLAVPLFALTVAGAGRLLAGPRWFRPLLLLGLAVLGAHLLLDLATSYGTQLFSPFSPRKFSLDWVFIIDPYLTAFLAAGAALTLVAPRWGRPLGGFFLAAGVAYFLLCGLFHHQALGLARRVFPGADPETTVAALPQPFSCRRWHLLSAGPHGISQAFVELPAQALWRRVPASQEASLEVSPEPDCRAPGASYRPPHRLVVLNWTPAPPPGGPYASEAREVMETYFDFARFPLLHYAGRRGEGWLLEWLDLRFTVPGRAFPFVFQVRLDGGGRLEEWTLGRCRGSLR